MTMPVETPPQIDSTPLKDGPYSVILKVSYGLRSTTASYRDGRWHGIPDGAVVACFAPISPTDREDESASTTAIDR